MGDFDEPGDPPPPPPLPPQRALKPASFAMRVKAAPPGYFYQPAVESPYFDLLEARTGTYFFYGSLLDPTMLRDILSLDSEPILRPAYIVGYHCKLWGQYPALLNGPTGNRVYGAAYHVDNVADAEKLANYETSSYRTTSCLIHYADDATPTEGFGFTFRFCGNPADLSGGQFDLKSWMERMGRRCDPKLLKHAMD